MIVLAVRVVVKLANLLLVIFDARNLLPASQILLCHLTERVLPKPVLKHPLNEMALQQQFSGRVKSAYQSLNCCLTALQHKTYLMEKMADKPCEILRPRGEHQSTVWMGAVSEDLSFSCGCFAVFLPCRFHEYSLFLCFNFFFFYFSLMKNNDAQWSHSFVIDFNKIGETK